MLCKCSGKYIDIYFILKIKFLPSCNKDSHELCTGAEDSNVAVMFDVVFGGLGHQRNVLEYRTNL